MSSKPGEKALMAMKELNKKAVISEFKKPSLPVIKNTAKKPKYKIITEEDYIEQMGKIIQRDYFPDLSKLKAQNEYLDALASNDLVKLRQIYNKYQTKSPALSRLNSPATFETPMTNTGEQTPLNIPSSFEPGTSRSTRSNSSVKSNSSTKSVASSHTLDSFLDTYTSEDNQSFQEIIEAADRKLREKYQVLFDAEQQSEDQQQKALALPSISDQFMLPAPKTIDYWTYKNQNAVMYTPDNWQLTKEEQIEMAKNKQQINRSNTRLNCNPFDESQNKQIIHQAAKATAKTMGDKVGFDGNTIEASQTPQVRGFSFVKDPSPMPGVDQSPLMTWGEIEGTPFRLDGGDTPLHPTVGPSFRISEVSRREAIGLQLAGDVTEKARQKKEKAMETAKRNISASPHVRSSLDRLNSMSPAARRLASVKLGFCSTPSPSRTPSKTPSRISTSLFKKVTPSPLMVRRKTPLIKSTSTKSTPVKDTEKDSSSLTDNLLSLPNKRQKAADFF